MHSSNAESNLRQQNLVSRWLHRETQLYNPLSSLCLHFYQRNLLISMTIMTTAQKHLTEPPPPPPAILDSLWLKLTARLQKVRCFRNRNNQSVMKVIITCSKRCFGFGPRLRYPISCSCRSLWKQKIITFLSHRIYRLNTTPHLSDSVSP